MLDVGRTPGLFYICYTVQILSEIKLNERTFCYLLVQLEIREIIPKCHCI